MKQLIMDVLEDMSEGQINLASEAARLTIANTIMAAIKTNNGRKGWVLDLSTYNGKPKLDMPVYEKSDEQIEKEKWVCSICGKNTFDVDYDNIGSEYNHLGCELELEMKDDKRVTEDRRQGDRREKNWSQKKHEDKVFIAQAEEIDGMYFDDEVKEWEEAVGYKEEVKKTDTLIDKSVEDFERNKLSEEIVDDKDAGYIYESPDGGKTVYRRESGSDKKTKIKIEVQD